MRQPDSDTTTTLVPEDPSDWTRHVRGDARWSTVLPARLIVGAGEHVPAVIRNLSPSGVQILTDGRFSPCLPPPYGSRITMDFFVDDLALTQAVLEVVSITRSGPHQLLIGCRFVHPPPAISTALRHAVARHVHRRHT